MRRASLLLLCVVSPGCGREAPQPAIKTTVTELPIEDRWITSPNGRLRVSQSGEGGIPVILVHSLAGNRGQWKAQVSHLARTRRVIAVDLLGHGESDLAKDGNYTPAAASGEIAAVADSLSLGRFVLVGHSRGGAVVLSYASTHPQRVAGLAFADPTGDMRLISAKDWQQFIAPFKAPTYDVSAASYWTQILQGADSAVHRQVMTAFRATPRDVVVRSLEGLRTLDATAALKAYPGPKVTIVTPNNNFPISLHKLVPDLPAKVITGVSHWLQMDRPAEFNRYLDEFLSRVASTGA